MDALKMLKTAKRCCKSVESCSNCPISNNGAGIGICLFQSVPERLDLERMAFSVSVLESWEREHPSKTRGELFLERNPECKRSAVCSDTPDVRPCDYDESINYPAVCCRFDECDACRKAYWKEPVE